MLQNMAISSFKLIIVEPTSSIPENASPDLDLDIGLTCGSGSCYAIEFTMLMNVMYEYNN